MPSPAERRFSSWRALPVSARRVLLAELISTAGSGLVLPFLAVYVSRVRDLGPVTASLSIAALAAGSLPANLAAGAIADRYHPRPVLVGGWVLAAVGDVLLLNATHWFSVLPATMAIGIGAGTAYPASSTLLASLSSDHQRPLVFATRHGLSNLGLSLGIGVSAIIAGHPDLDRFQLLYALDATTFLMAAAVLSLTPLPDPTPTNIDQPATATPPDQTPNNLGGYRTVLADNGFRWVTLIQVLLVMCGYAQFHAALPIYLSRPDGLGPDVIAVVFLANTLLVAVTALPLAHLARRCPRRVLIGGGASSFAACWILLQHSHGHTAPAMTFAILASLLMGAGEVQLAPAISPLINDLAPPELRGRYNALEALILSAGTILGPAAVALLYHGRTTTPLFTFLIAGCLTAALLTTPIATPTRIRETPAFSTHPKSLPTGST